jgi:hypothetical protein
MDARVGGLALTHAVGHWVGTVGGKGVALLGACGQVGVQFFEELGEVGRLFRGGHRAGAGRAKRGFLEPEIVQVPGRHAAFQMAVAVANKGVRHAVPTGGQRFAREGA